MNLKQSAQITMGGTAITVIDINAAAWMGYSPFADGVEKLKGVYDTISGCIAMQRTKTNGTTLAKGTLRRNSEAQILHVADVVALHYRLTGKLQEVYDVACTKSSLRGYSDAGYIGHATKVMSVAGMITPSILTALGLSPTQLTDAGDTLELFVKAIGSPRQVKGISKLGTANLANAVDEMMRIFTEELDPAARALRYSKPDFYFEYKSARELIDPPHRTRQLTVTVSAMGGERLEKVNALLMPGDIAKLTGAKGIFYVQDLEGGVYSMKLSCPGYADKTIDFAIIANEHTKLDIEMTPHL